MMLHNLPVAHATAVPPCPRRPRSPLGLVGVGLLGALCLLPAAPAQAQSTVNYSFEDGLLHGTPTAMKVPPKILTENGNHFMRITGSSSDKQSIPASHPARNRSTVTFTSKYSSMPLLSSTTMRQTYSAKVRFHDNTGSDGVVLELFQDGPQSGGYGTPDGNGPVFICWRNNGRVKCRANYANETKATAVDLGVMPAGTWYTFKVNAVWSHNASQGRIELYVNGSRRLLVTGRDSNLGPTSSRIPAFKLGLYGDYAVGQLDVDNVTAKPWLPSASSSPMALSTPTNVRLVQGE
jgi:polysaccharide lyase-like protein